MILLRTMMVIRAHGTMTILLVVGFTMMMISLQPNSAAHVAVVARMMIVLPTCGMILAQIGMKHVHGLAVIMMMTISWHPNNAVCANLMALTVS